MRRRDFIKAIVGSATAWPLIAHAQQPARLPTIGFLGTSTPEVWGTWVTAFEQRLKELRREGPAVIIEYRWAEGKNERYSEIASEFVRLKVDVIVTAGSGVHDVTQATSAIPIIFAIAFDPVGSGFVQNLARPGGNVTGLSLQTTDLAAKRIELLREVVPNLRRLAIMANPEYSGGVLEKRELEATARTLGLELAPLEVRRAEDITSGFATLRADALYPVVDSLVAASRTRIITLAVAARLPTIFNTREHVKAGGLMSYGPNYPDLFRRAAEMVDRILRGTKPADIPVEQPTKFDLAVNLTTAKAIGLTIPPGILALADVVFE